MFSRVSAVEVSHNFRNPNPDDLHQDMMLNFFGSSRTCTWNGAKWTMTLERCYNDILKVFFPFEKLSYRFPILETSATALCGTTGIDLWWFTSSTRTRRGGSCLKDIYKTFLVYRTCMRLAPAKPARACTLRNCHMSHLKPTSHFTLDRLHTPHCTLHTALFTLQSSHFTLHTLHTSHCTLRSQHFTLHTPHFTLHTPHFILHTPHFTLHSSCPTLHTAPFISSELFSPYPSWALLISSLLICHLSFHESLPSTTTKELACAVHQNYAHRNNHSKLLHREALHSKLSRTASFFTEKLLHTASFHTQQAFTHRTLTHSAFTHGKRLHTHSKLFKQRSFYTQQAFTQRSFYTQQAFTHSKRLHIEHLRTVLLHMASVYTHRNFYTETLLQRSFYTQQAFTEKVFAQRSFLVHNHNRNCSSKTGSRRQSDKKTILKHFLKGILKGKLLAPKLRKSADKSLSQPWCSHSNTIYDLQLQKTIVLRMQPLHQATLTQPLQCDLHRLSCKTQ